MASSRHPIIQMCVELAIKAIKRWPANCATVAGTFIASATVAPFFRWTWLMVFLLTLFSLPVKTRVVEPEIWLHRYRRLLATESMRFPGRKEALQFRKRELARIKNTRKQFAAVCATNGLTNAAKQTPTLHKLTSLADGSLTAPGVYVPIVSSGHITRSARATKHEITDFDPVAMVKGARSHRWKYKGDLRPDWHFGPMAEDLPEELQVTVHESEGVAVKGVYDSAMVGVLWEMNRVLVERIEALEAKK